MKKIEWFQRQFQFGLQPGILPFCLDRLDGTIVRIEAKVSGITDTVLSIKHDNKWSIKQNIGHLAELDIITAKRLADLRNGNAEMSPAVFEPAGDYNAMPVAQIIDILKQNRDRLIADWKRLSETELTKTSLHPRMKVMMNAVDLAFFHAEHDDHHLVRINELIQTTST